MYKIYSTIDFEQKETIEIGQRKDFVFSDKVDLKNNYVLNVVGEVALDYIYRYEGLLPIFYRKLDNSILFLDGEKVLLFNKRNQTKERIAHALIKEGLDSKKFRLSIKAKISDLKEDFTITAYVYYGAPNSRYYYEQADKTISINLLESEDFVEYSKEFTVDKEVSFIMLKIDATDFTGEAQLFCPQVINDMGQNVCPEFDYCPDELVNFKWVGEGFSYFEKPEYVISINGNVVYDGVIMDRLERFAGFRILVDSDLLKERDNVVSIEYKDSNVYPYTIKQLRLLTAPKDFELLGVKKTIPLNQSFGIFVYAKSDDISVDGSEYFDYLGFERANANYGILKFKPKKIGNNISVKAKSKGKTSSIIIEDILDLPKDNVITGTGDFIYVAQDEDEFAEYLTWYLNEDIGDLLTFRCVYHWCGTEQISYDFWKFAGKLLSALEIYFSMMRDGRELNGANVTPPDDFFQTQYYLGSQTHERDGAFTYWGQSVRGCDELYYHILSRKLKYNGIYGKRSPVYDKTGTPKLYYASDKAENIKEAYENLKENLRLTGVDGASRHTGVTTFFRTFYEAGYDWVGYESMYGPHELMLSVLRGTAGSFGKENFGTHLALQWSTVPTDDRRHYIRYGLSLYLSYMHGVREINTEEGLWRIENTYADFDKFSDACVGHTEWQTRFNKFVNTNVRRGAIKKKIAMLIGKYDGMEGFSSPYLFGQARWKYDSPEKSWELLKVFYPDNDINSIYYYITEGGKNNVPEKDRKLMEVRSGLYRDVIDYKPVGFYTNTPYGVIDVIPVESKNLSDYAFLFFTGWNTCDESQLKSLCEYVENGGTLLLSKPHLYDTVIREDALSGKATVIDSPYVDKLLGYEKTGRVIYFDKDAYPIDYYSDYASVIKDYAEKYSTPVITDTKYLSYTEYTAENNTQIIYLLNINWWDDQPAKYTVNVGGKRYKMSQSGNDILVLTVCDDIAVYTDNLFVSVQKIEDGKVYLKGNGKTKLFAMNAKGKTTYDLTVEGEKIVNI